MEAETPEQKDAREREEYRREKLRAEHPPLERRYSDREEHCTYRARNGKA